MEHLWIVGRVRDPAKPEEWEFMGVFDSQNAAVDACTEWSDFVEPTLLNERKPDEPVDWPGRWYPIAVAQAGSV